MSSFEKVQYSPPLFVSYVYLGTLTRKHAISSALTLPAPPQTACPLSPLRWSSYARLGFGVCLEQPRGAYSAYNFSVSCSSSSLLFASGVAVFIIECGSQRSPEDQTQVVRLARQAPSLTEPSHQKHVQKHSFSGQKLPFPVLEWDRLQRTHTHWKIMDGWGEGGADRPPLFGGYRTCLPSHFLSPLGPLTAHSLPPWQVPSGGNPGGTILPLHTGTSWCSLFLLPLQKASSLQYPLKMCSTRHRPTWLCSSLRTPLSLLFHTEIFPSSCGSQVHVPEAFKAELRE